MKEIKVRIEFIEEILGNELYNYRKNGLMSVDVDKTSNIGLVKELTRSGK